MKKSLSFLCAAIILISVFFAGCKGSEGGKITDRNDTPVLTQLESELSTIADMVTDIIPDMSGNISDKSTQ